MNHSPEMQEVLELVRKENRRTQIVFGGGIIVLSIVIMIIAPGGVRSFVDRLGSDTQSALPPDMRQLEEKNMMGDAGEPTTPVSTATSSVPHLK